MREVETNNSMEESTGHWHTEPLDIADLPALFSNVPLLAGLKGDDLRCFEGAELVSAEKGAKLFDQGSGWTYFWVLLEGAIRTYKEAEDGSRIWMIDFGAGETAGEVPILLGRRSPSAQGEVLENSRLVRVTEEGFWRLMATCPLIRAGILKNMASRFELYQALTLHREKLISLGTMAAGLMHELNNPGAAARRAASQLRENMNRLQSVGLRMARSPLSTEQLDCLAGLKERVFSYHQPVALSSLEQSDREEAFSAWLEDLGVENPWLLAPAMVSAGWEQCDVACAQHSFPKQILSDTLNYLGAMISSVQLVGTIEESIIRVTDLVTAVKKYAYDDKRVQQRLDVRDGLISTLTILGHKLRQKQLTVEKNFPRELLAVSCAGAGLSQVWTNLLDNAIDAAPEGSAIGVRVWQEQEWICVGILDHGPGIPHEHRDHIFEPFFTTKAVGVGTGLGLDIAHRIVVGSFQGQIDFSSEPGKTEFVVRLPISTESCTVGAGETPAIKAQS